MSYSHNPKTMFNVQQTISLWLKLIHFNSKLWALSHRINIHKPGTRHGSDVQQQLELKVHKEKVEE